MTNRQALALAAPCWRAYETTNQRYSGLERSGGQLLSTILTVNK